MQSLDAARIAYRKRVYQEELHLLEASDSRLWVLACWTFRKRLETMLALSLYCS